jgi:hypothetical protein
MIFPLLRPLALTACALLLPLAADAQSTGASAPITYVYLRGASDTLGTEVITRSPATVQGVLSMKGVPRIVWTQAHSGGVPGALTLQVYMGAAAANAAANADANAAPSQTATVTMRGDSAQLDAIVGAQTMHQALPSRSGALALVNSSVLHAALLASRARALKADTLPVFLTSGAQTMNAVVTQSGDTTVFAMAGMAMRIVAASDGLPSTIGIAAQGVRVVRAGHAVAPPKPPEPISYDAPPGAPYTAEEVHIATGRGYELVGTLTRPAGAGKLPVMITITGSGQQERDERLMGVLAGYALFRDVADTLGRRGIAVLRVDDRGAGASGGRSTLATATSADFADDVRASVAWVRTRRDLDAARIGLVGHSEGGMIAPMVAATDPAIRAIALLAGPAYNGRQILLFQNRQGIDQMPGLSATQRDSIFATVPAQLDSVGRATPWIGYFMQHDPVATARQVKQPVLILQGATDRQVTPEQADTLAAAFRAAGNRAVTMRKFPDTNHLFLWDPTGLPSGYGQLADTHIRRDVLGALSDWAVAVMK